MAETIVLEIPALGLGGLRTSWDSVPSGAGASIGTPRMIEGRSQAQFDGRTIEFTINTAWTSTLPATVAGTFLIIAET
jgi:hypothetical protein